MKNEDLYYIITLELGIVILDRGKNVIYFDKFKDPINSHEKFKNRDYNDVLGNMEFLDKYKSCKILTNFPEAISLLKNKDFEAIEKISPQMESFIQINKINFYLQSNHFSNEKEIINDLRDFSLKWSSIRVQEASEQLDLHISQSINALDEIDKISNTLGTRMREWYGLHFP